MELSGVSPLGKDFTVIGVAGDHTEALRYVANLRDSPLFAEARFVRLDGAGGGAPDSIGTVGFQIKVIAPVEEEDDPESNQSQ